MWNERDPDRGAVIARAGMVAVFTLMHVGLNEAFLTSKCPLAEYRSIAVFVVFSVSMLAIWAERSVDHELCDMDPARTRRLTRALVAIGLLTIAVDAVERHRVRRASPPTAPQRFGGPQRLPRSDPAPDLPVERRFPDATDATTALPASDDRADGGAGEIGQARAPTVEPTPSEPAKPGQAATPTRPTPEDAGNAQQPSKG